MGGRVKFGPMSDELTYRAAGVDIEQAERSLRSVTDAIQATYDHRVIGGVGSFGGLFEPQFDLERPVLVSSIDGVGTKTKVAQMMGRYDGLGHDIVNHCVNDILCQGARPLFFLDYFGCSHLDPLVFNQVVRGAAEACSAVGCPLIGGETAEMPGTFVEDEFDVVGCIVGVVEFEQRLPRGPIDPGDALIGLASSGLHTNGFSLARRAIFEVGGLSVRDEVAGLDRTIGEELLRPHRCYLKAVGPLLSLPEVKAIAHITGGGIKGNLVRVLPADAQAVVDRRSWTPLPIFRLIQEVGAVPDAEMIDVFNMGIGMILVVAKDFAPAIVQRLQEAGEAAAIVGEIVKGAREVRVA